MCHSMAFCPLELLLPFFAMERSQILLSPPDSWRAHAPVFVWDLQVCSVDASVQPPSYGIELGGGKFRETEATRLGSRGGPIAPVGNLPSGLGSGPTRAAEDSPIHQAGPNEFSRLDFCANLCGSSRCMCGPTAGFTCGASN